MRVEAASICGTTSIADPPGHPATPGVWDTNMSVKSRRRDRVDNFLGRPSW
jgi:hypothetical protein